MMSLGWKLWALFISIFDCFLQAPPFLENKGLLKKVALIRVDAIGDFILWLDSAKEYRRLYPQDRYRIILIANNEWAELAQMMLYWDEVWPVNRALFIRDFIYRFKFLKKIFNEHFDLAIYPTFSREFLYGDSLVRASRAPQRIGSVSNCSNIRPFLKKISDRWYTKLISASEKPLMELQRNAEFIRELGLETFSVSSPQISVNWPPGIKIDSPYYVLFPGAGFFIRNWPVDKFRRLAEMIYSKTKLLGVVCGGKKEGDVAKQLVEGTQANLNNMVGQTSLKDLISIIQRAKFVVSNETSAMHIASALGVPVVGIVGGGHFGRFVPYDLDVVDPQRPVPKVVNHFMDCYGCNWQCIYGCDYNTTAPCLSNIEVNAVWKEIEKIL